MCYFDVHQIFLNLFIDGLGLNLIRSMDWVYFSKHKRKEFGFEFKDKEDR